MKLTQWAPLLLLLLVGGCSQELRRGGAETPDHLTASEVGLRFVLSTPAGDVVAFTRSAIQTESEYLIEQLDIFQFSGTVGNEVLEQSYLNQSFTKVGEGASLVLKVKGLGEKKFVFVANNKGNGVVKELQALPAGTKLADFEKLVTESTEGVSLSSPLLMLGSTPVINVEEGMPAHKVQLMRIMARLDIKNYEPYLTLKRVRLQGVNDRGSLSIDGVATDAEVINLPVVDLPTDVTPIGTDPEVVMEAVPEKVDAHGVVYEPAHVHYKHVYYPYASNEVTAEEHAPVLIIEGTLFAGDPEREHDVVYKKVLQLDGVDKFLGFKRNHRYTVAIEGGAVQGDADIKLYVNEWNLVELPIEEIEPMAPVQEPREGYGRYILIFNDRYDEGAYILNADKIVVCADLGAKHVSGLPQVLIMMQANTDWEILVDGKVLSGNMQATPWLFAQPLIEHWSNIIPNYEVPRCLELKFTEVNNTGKDRSVVLQLRSKVDHSKVSTFTVVQSAKSEVR